MKIEFHMTINNTAMMLVKVTSVIPSIGWSVRIGGIENKVTDIVADYDEGYAEVHLELTTSTHASDSQLIEHLKVEGWVINNQGT